MPPMQRTDYAELDNPVWHALSGLHRHFAEVVDDTRWFPSTIAPFVAVAAAEVLPDLNAAATLGLREPAYFVGVLPNSLPDGWRVASRSEILQMFPAPGDLPQPDEDGIRELGLADRPSMLALARVAFPDFFRERTADLGLYLGIFKGSDLVAMAGERMAYDGLQEISGVCTHPDFLGRGSARRLTRALMRRHRQRGVASFLHVSEGNAAARRLYESMGFTARASLSMAKIERRAETRGDFLESS
jgi:ribosomal protein S18 acetylase RimI-like enzyme